MAIVNATALIAGVGGRTAAAARLVLASARIAGTSGPINVVRNPRMEGAVLGVVGSGGAYPTNWGTIGVTAGLTVTILNTGIDSATGVPYVDIQYSGTTIPTANFQVSSFDVLNAASSPFDQWAGSAYIALIGGDLSCITGLFVQQRLLGGGGTPA
jgi:hypothetical protein